MLIPKAVRQLGSYLVVAILSVVLTSIGLHGVPGGFAPAIADSGDRASAPVEVAQAPSSSGTRNFVAAAVRRVGPAVVRINTERTVAQANPFDDDPFFRRFFSDRNFPPPQQRARREVGQGSGFIIDSSGIVLTNAHVVSGVDAVTVVLRDGRRFQGRVRGLDQLSDLAVVKIDGSDLPVAPLGNSSQVSVGDWAIAVGNPLGLDNTVTLGIVSMLDRSSSDVGIPDKRLDLIQTDAAINPGNSGGPLLNDRGEVVGINTAIRSDGQGIGFAIAIDRAKAIKDRLAQGERIRYPFIGIRMMTLTPDTARDLTAEFELSPPLPETNGVLVVRVLPNSPAAQAGVQPGDVAIEVGGERITDAGRLQDIVEATPIGQPLDIAIQRGGQTLRLTVSPGELDPTALRR
ncbi:trypsin-like serine protease [Rubidibacter lacunae KORDI 51-2]|uniref:Trypsin-like serine protease n=1 Tax=Rubidibacter lacunae KORDI 51-2 TaxID=582515 RepID=U5DKN4_9CHRO|nr:HhoA/HhoB/HtrA family serine endopeptidase [Rubidibacter lacunae]ERN41109.1 trypsin-like serine protease [Rubidibacter lacunae KORDI 51-2]